MPTAPLPKDASQTAAPASARFLLGCLTPILIVAVALGAWELLAAHGLISTLFFPAPSTTLAMLSKLMIDGTLLNAIGASLRRLAMGLAIGVSIGLLAGMAMGWSPRLRLVVDPFIAVAHPVPVTAILPFLIVLLGVGEHPRIAAVAIAAFFPMLISAMSAVSGIDPVHIEVARSYRMQPFRILWRVIVPCSLPSLLTGLRLSFNSGMTLMIVTELLTARDGIGGGLIMTGWRTLELARLFTGLLTLGLIGITFNQMIKNVIARQMPWHREISETGG